MTMQDSELMSSRRSPDMDYDEDMQFTQSGGVLRKKLYDKNLADWSAKYRKNKQILDALCKDCDSLRVEVSRTQRAVDERILEHKRLDDQLQASIFMKFRDVETAYKNAKEERERLQMQLSQNRADKGKLTKDKKILKNDHERKQAEYMRMVEVHDKLENQQSAAMAQLQQLTLDRRRMERDLEEVNHDLRAKTDEADEVTSQIYHVQDGIKDSMDLHMAPMDRIAHSVGHVSTNDLANVGDMRDVNGQEP
jgi:chromosome segregation ATPase